MWTSYRKDRSKANRGKQLEDFINFANQQYERDGTAVIVKVPTEFMPIRGADGSVVSAKVTRKSCVDYIGRFRERPIAIEAKHISSNRIPFSEVQDHQAEFLDEWVKDGALGYVLVSFSMLRFFLVPWECWRASRDIWKNKSGIINSVSVNCYKDIGCGIEGPQVWEYTTNRMASAKAEDFPDIFEVKPGGRYGLDYLKTVIAERGGRTDAR